MTTPREAATEAIAEGLSQWQVDSHWYGDALPEDVLAKVALDALLQARYPQPCPPTPSRTDEERSRHFNETCGVRGYMSKRGLTGADLHPDRCTCQNETTPHKHYTDLRCARCLLCSTYTPAVPTEVSNGTIEVPLLDALRSELMEGTEHE